jgi:hypothetical protein
MWSNVGMKNPCLALMCLTLELSQVIGLRIMKLSRGGREAWDEARLMLSEKIDAAVESGATLALGGSYRSVLELYRIRVAANAARLVGYVMR